MKSSFGSRSVASQLPPSGSGAHGSLTAGAPRAFTFLNDPRTSFLESEKHSLGTAFWPLTSLCPLIINCAPSFRPIRSFCREVS